MYNSDISALCLIHLSRICQVMQNEQSIQKERGDVRSKDYMKAIKERTQNGK